MQPSRADLGLAILLYLKLAKLTQTKLARLSKVSDRTISDWKSESDRRFPSRKLVEQVAVALGVTFADLYATASYIADLRIKREAAISTPKQLSLVEESSALGSLSKAELIMELGRARDRQLNIEAELETRRRSDYRYPS